MMPTAAPSPAQRSALAIEEKDKLVLAASRSCLENGHITEAAQLLEQLPPPLAEPPYTALHFAVRSTLGEIYQKQGKLHLAAATYQALLDWVDCQPPNQELFRFHYGLCALYYEWNQLEKASQYLQGCVELIARCDLPPGWAVEGYLRLAWIHWAEGDNGAAHAALHQARALAARTDQPQLARQVAAHWARWWLRQGELEPALHWASENRLGLEDCLRYSHRFEALTLVRIWLAENPSAPVLPLLYQLQRAATVDGRTADRIKLAGLKAIAYAAQGDRRRGWIELAQALCRAEREEYVRTFVDEGLPMRELLQQTAAKGVTLIYVKKLLTSWATFSGNRIAPTSVLHEQPQSKPTLVEPLTPREEEVLQLVAAGNANSEIANRLSISPTTVKKHLGNILGKLGAKNRTAAVAKARAFDLL